MISLPPISQRADTLFPEPTLFGDPSALGFGGLDLSEARPKRGAGGGAGEDRHRDRQGAGADRLARVARRAGICRRSIDHHPRRRRNRRADRGTQKERAMTARRGWIIAAVLLALLLIAATFPMRLTIAWSGATDAGGGTGRA